MKIYEIRDAENDLSIGTLLYYSQNGDCIIELQEDLDEWNAPLLFTGLVKEKIFTVPRELSFLWVKERVIPSGRQNIDSILKTHRLKEYDEMRFLELSEGKCCQDHLYMKRMDSLPDYVLDRQGRNVIECFLRENNTLLCFFADDTVRKVNLSELSQMEGVDKILDNPLLYRSGKVGTGGYFITFNDSIDIPASVLYRAGTILPVTLQDFLEFAQNNLFDTTQSCELLECSRQNLSYLQKQKKITPVKQNVKGNLYRKGDVLKLSWL